MLYYRSPQGVKTSLSNWNVEGDEIHLYDKDSKLVEVLECRSNEHAKNAFRFFEYLSETPWTEFVTAEKVQSLGGSE